MIDATERNTRKIFHFSACVKVLIVSLFWDVALCIFLVGYRRFGATYRSHLQESSHPRRILLGWLGPLKMKPVGCIETSVNIYKTYATQYPRRSMASTTAAES
jgi:hypothetical protein